jgi:hypothetical protein
MKSQQLSFDLQPPEKPPTTEEEIVRACFWLLHLEDCDCKINWWKWEEQTKRNIWEII